MTGMRVALGTVAHAHRLMHERVRRPPWTADRLRADDPRTAAARTAVRRVRAAGRARRAADMAPVPPALGLGRIPCVAEPEHAEADRVAGCRSRGEDACGMRPRASRLTCMRHGWRVARTARQRTRSAGGRAAVDHRQRSARPGRWPGLAAGISSGGHAGLL